MLTIGCAPRYGTYVAHTGHQPFGCLMQINEDSTFLWNSWSEWYSRNSFGKWISIPNKKNHLFFISSSSDYSHIPIYVRESHKEQTGATIIFSQGKQFYNCEFNEILINGKTIPIDKDTIAINCHVDSLCVRLRYSEEGKKRRLWVLYDVVCSNIYYNYDVRNNVFEISLPEYPHYSKSGIYHPHAASDLFAYIPMEGEAFYKNGKWYVGEKKIPYKRLKERKKKE